MKGIQFVPAEMLNCRLGLVATDAKGLAVSLDKTRWAHNIKYVMA